MRMIGNFIETPEMRAYREKTCGKICKDDCSKCNIYLLSDLRIESVEK